MIIVSACLLGICCRYDGKTKASKDIINLLKNGNPFIPICPEQLGGLPTPRHASEIVGGDGYDVLLGQANVIQKKTGQNVTENFIKGARQALYIAKLYKIDKAYLKAKSPSCGLTFPIGVTAATLCLEGIKVEEID